MNINSGGNENCVLVLSSYIDVCNFSYDTQREWKLVLEQKECFRSIAMWMTKTQQNNLLQNLSQFINILIPILMQAQYDSYFKPWFICSPTIVIREMKHQMCVIPQIIFITRCDTPHRTIYLAWLVRLNLKVSVIQEMNLQESTHRRDEFTRKYTSFWLSHHKCDSGDNTVGW